MRLAFSALHTPIDVGLGGVLLANMLVAWLDGNPRILPTGEATDESQDPGTSPERGGIELLTAIDTEPGPPTSGEHGAAVCAAREGTRTALERSLDPYAGSGPRKDGHRDGEAGGLQDLGGGGLDGTSRRGVCVGGLAVGALKPRLASTAGVVRAHRNAGDRRRWLLRSGGLQRRIVTRIAGPNGPGRTTLFARAPPGREAQQGEERRVAFPRSGGFLLRRANPYRHGPGRGSAGRRGLGIPPVSRNGQRVRGDATIRGKRVTLSHAVLWWGFGLPDYMGSPDAQTGSGATQDPVLCRDVRLWPVSVSP